MKDLEMYFDLAKRRLDSLDIKYGKVSKVEINTRAKSRWGQCIIRREYVRKPWEEKVFEININIDLLNDNVADEILMNTIIHELLHTCKGCFNHGEEWKMYAEIVNDCYSCYNIERCTESKDKGIKYNKLYNCKCKSCGNEFGRDRICKFIKNPNNYRCGYCHNIDWEITKRKDNNYINFI